MKKVLSLVLVVALVLSSMTFAFASPFSDVTGNYDKAITALSGLGVVTGYPDGTFKPAQSITRAEAAKLIIETLGYKNLVTASKANFSDTSGHWAEGHLALATGLGLTAGYPDGSFKPDNQISYDEVLTMIVRALGYTDASLKGTWPTNYKLKAVDLKLNKDVVMSKTLADRGGVAQVVYNALEKSLVQVNDKNIAEAVTTAPLTLLDKIAKYDANYEVNADKLDPEHTNYGGNKVDLAPYMYQSLKVYLNDDKDVVYVKGTNNLVFEGVIKATNAVSSTAIALKDSKDETYTFALTSTGIMLNGVEITNEEWLEIDNGNNVNNVKVTVVTTAKDDATLAKTGLTAKGLVAEKQTKVAKISDVYVAGKANVDAFNLPTKDSKVDLTKVVVTGSAKTLEEIKKNDIVVEYKGIKNDGTLVKTKLAVSNAVVTGKVTRVDGNDRYIDGVKYTLNLGAGVTLNLNDEGNFMLDHNSRIAKYEVKSGTSNYAAVISTAAGEITGDFGKSIKTYERIKLSTVNGPVVYDVYLKIDSDGNVKGSATTGSGVDKVYTATTMAAAKFTSSAIAGLTDGEIVKYEVNSDGQLSKIVKVGASTTFDKEKSSFVLASDALIFNDAKTDNPVISVGMLKTSGSAVVAYDTAGRIKAMVVASASVKSGEATNYGYVTKVNSAVNAKGDTVQLIVAYINGVKVEHLTDDVYGAATAATVQALDITDGVITKVATLTGVTATVSSISTDTNSITVTESSVSVRYFLAKDATILQYDSSATTKESVKDLYDIKDKSVTYYKNSDGDIAYIYFVKQ